MITKITGEQPFQVLTNNFSISPSSEGYTLQISADGKNYSNLFTVGAGVTRLVTGVAANSFYRLSGNQSQVSINWMKTCVTEGGSGGSGTELSPVTEFPEGADAGTVVAYNGTASASGVYQYTGEEWVPVGVDDLSDYWTSAQTKDYVDEAVSGISLDGYWTSAETQSAITAVEDHLYDVEQVTASALTELHEGLVEVSGRPSPDMSLYTPTSGFSTINGSAITNGGNIVIQSDLTDYWTSGETKAYVDSAITGVQDQIDVMDEVVATSLVDLNDRIVELSGSSVDLSAYYTSAQTEDAISAATSGKADAANVTPNIYRNFPLWNEQGIITGVTEQAIIWPGYLGINGRGLTVFSHNSNLGNIYTPTTPGTAGDILVADGTNTPKWSAVTFPTPDVDKAYVDSAITGVQDQIDVMDEVVSDALNDLNGQMASKVSSASVSTIWRGTQAEYNAIATKDPATLYIIL